MPDVASIWYWLAMPIVTMVGIVVASYFSVRALRVDSRQREAERVRADGQRDALLAQLVKGQERIDAQFENLAAELRVEMKGFGAELRAEMKAQAAELRAEFGEKYDRLHTEIAQVRIDLQGEIKGVREDLGNEIKGVREDLQGEIKREIKSVREDLGNEIKREIKSVREDLGGEIRSVRDALKAHEDKCELRWQRQASEFGEMRGILAALQRTVERAFPEPA